METKKTITLLGKELAISQIYKTRSHVNDEYTGVCEAIDIDLRDLTSFITNEEDAERLAEEMSEYIYNEVYNDCKAKAEEGEVLYAYRTLMIDLIGTGRYNSGYITASAMYIECESIGDRCFTFFDRNIDRKDEEDEEGNKIEESVKYNAILDALKREVYSLRMDEKDQNDFERLEEEAQENYRRLHHEEFYEEEDN